MSWNTIKQTAMQHILSFKLQGDNSKRCKAASLSPREKPTIRSDETAKHSSKIFTKGGKDGISSERSSITRFALDFSVRYSRGNCKVCRNGPWGHRKTIKNQQAIMPDSRNINLASSSAPTRSKTFTWPYYWRHSVACLENMTVLTNVSCNGRTKAPSKSAHNNGRQKMSLYANKEYLFLGGLVLFAPHGAVSKRVFTCSVKFR